MESRRSQGQREAAALEPQHGGAQIRRDSQQRATAAFLLTLQEDLDNCRHLTHVWLAQLQLQQRVVEQKHQNLISQKLQHQAVMEQDQDTAGTETTSADSCSSSSTSDDLEEHTERLEKLSVQAGSKHQRLMWTNKEHQCWAQDTSSTGHSTAKEGRRAQRGTSMLMVPGQAGPAACGSGSSSIEPTVAMFMCYGSTKGILVQCGGKSEKGPCAFEASLVAELQDSVAPGSSGEVGR
ncbi:uncharacterized protein [Excalfactoria chinensis]|uniref:uncharacterized protein n=1 Tax=Excalfactoria chinensis TaxID=46218 RepID=UPI003B3AF4A6